MSTPNLTLALLGIALILNAISRLLIMNDDLLKENEQLKNHVKKEKTNDE